MSELFITKIRINEVRHLKDFEIPLSETERKHLILTGRNGSGKTSVLEAIKDLHFAVMGVDLAFEDYFQSLLLDPLTPSGLNVWDYFYVKLGVDDLKVHFSENWSDLVSRVQGRDWIFLHFPARRKPQFEEPVVIERFEEYVGRNFLKYLLNITADKSFAKEENDLDAVRRTDEWLARFREILQELYGDSELSFEFNRQDYHYYIKQEGKNPVNLTQLPDGFASMIQILSEVLMQIQGKGKSPLGAEGLILIDEIESHLHIELQKKVFPFLTKLFPKIQFIVTTHSPFVLSSVDNAVICDLEKRIVTEDMHGYSYEAIAKAYFDAEDYSEQLKQEVNEYEKLLGSASLDDEGKERLQELEDYLSNVPDFYSDALQIRLQQIKLKHKRKAG